MDQVLTIKKNAEAGIIDFLKFLLQKDEIGGVFTLRNISKQGKYDYGLITDPELLKDAIPLHPLMPVNGGKMLSNFSVVDEKIAAVIKPCELRSFIELVKRSQGKLENFLLISYTCGGCFGFKHSVDNNIDEMLPDYWKVVAKGTDYKDIRETCKACEYFIPINADITVSVAGEKDLNSISRLYLHSEQAKRMAEGFEGDISDEEFDRSQYEHIINKRKEFKVKLFDQIKIKDTGLDGMIDVFGKCIGCHACSRVCPICYCILCDFESSTYDYDSDMMQTELSRKGGVRLPPDTVLYQLGRLSHMSFSCIGCGQCTEVCPADIPVSVIFRKIGEKVAEIFDYVPGRNVEEEVPVTIFKEEEFTSLGED